MKESTCILIIMHIPLTIVCGKGKKPFNPFWTTLYVHLRKRATVLQSGPYDFGIEIQTFIALFDNYFSCLEIYLVSTLLNRVSSVFFPFSSDIFLYFSFRATSKNQINLQQSFHPYSQQSSPALQSQPPIRKHVDGVQKVQLMYSAQTIRTHSKPVKNCTHARSSRPRKRGGVALSLHHPNTRPMS